MVLFPGPTKAETMRAMKRHRDQLVELLTNYGKIDMLCLDLALGLAPGRRKAKGECDSPIPQASRRLWTKSGNLDRMGEILREDAMKVLAIGAHPDDVEILCGGTLFRGKGKGDQVSICVLTDGSAGHKVIPPKELVKIRKREAEAAAKFLGAKLFWLGAKDEFLFDDEETRLKLAQVIRLAQPDLIISHSANDYHHDHQAGAKLAFSAGFIASLKHVKTGSPASNHGAYLYEMDTLTGIGFEPMEYVDISGSLANKLKMLSKHKSQVKWLKDHDGIDILEMVETQAKFRGYQAGVKYAEGFRLVQRWGSNPGKRVLP